MLKIKAIVKNKAPQKQGDKKGFVRPVPVQPKVQLFWPSQPISS